MYDTTKPDVLERYETAGNTSNLTVVDGSGGAGDMLIAAGWSPSRIGMALLRLHSEWSGKVKPRRADSTAIEAMAAGMLDERGRPDVHRARAAAQEWYANELRILANGLQSRAAVWSALSPWLAKKQIAPDVAAAAMLYWLDEACRRCDGLKQRKIVGQPALSAKVCHACQGSGVAPRPKGAGPLLVHLDYCVSVARSSLQRRLRTSGREAA